MREIIKQLLLYICLAIVFGPGLAEATDKTYVLSYSPGTLFHQLVRDRVDVVYKRAGLTADFKPLPHNRSVFSANEGIVDGDVGRVPSIEENNPNLLRVNVKLMDLNGAAYTLHAEIGNYDESLLRKYRVGYVLGVKWPQAVLDGREAITAPNYAALFEMLLDGRIDLALATEASADSVFNELQSRAKNIRRLLPSVFSAPIYHYVHKKNAEIVPRLEQAIKEINEEGVFVFYTGIQSPVFEILRQRLKEAFKGIGKICEVRSTGSSLRALQIANENGDGDAYRNKNVKKLNPDITSNLVVIPESIGNVEFYVYTKGKHLAVTDWTSLNGFKNGLRNGALILEKNIPEPQTRLPDTDRLLQMLQEDRLDTVTEHGVTADFRLKKLKLKGITKLVPSLASFPGYSYIHKKHASLIPAISASIADMKKEGRFEQIEREVIEKLLSAQAETNP